METIMPDWLKKARIDIKNKGEGNDVKVKVLKGDKSRVVHAAWLSKGGNGYMLVAEDQHLLLELECVGAGTLQLRLRGMNKTMPAGGRIPAWVDYTRLAVNEEIVFWELKPQWFDKPYAFNRKVSDGEKLKVEISWSEHAYKGEELAKLHYMWATLPEGKVKGSH